MTNSIAVPDPPPDIPHDDDEPMIGEGDDREGCGICWLVFSEKRKPENPCTEESCRKAKKFCGPCVKQWKSAWYAEDKNLGKPFLCPNCRTGVWGPSLPPRHHRHSSYTALQHRLGGVRRHPTSPVSPRFQRRRPTDYYQQMHLQYRGDVSRAARGMSSTATAHPAPSPGFFPAHSSHHPAYGAPVSPTEFHYAPAYFTPATSPGSYTPRGPSQPNASNSSPFASFNQEAQRLLQLTQTARYREDPAYRRQLDERLAATLQIPRLRARPNPQPPTTPQQPQGMSSQPPPAPGPIRMPSSMGSYPVHPQQPPPSTSSYFSPFQPYPYHPQLVPQPNHNSNEMLGFQPSPASPRNGHFPQRRSSSAPFDPDLQQYPSFNGGLNPASQSSRMSAYSSSGAQMLPSYLPYQPPAYESAGMHFGNAPRNGPSAPAGPLFNNFDLTANNPVLQSISLSPRVHPNVTATPAYGGHANWQGSSLPNR